MFIINVKKQDSNEFQKTNSTEKFLTIKPKSLVAEILIKTQI